MVLRKLATELRLTRATKTVNDKALLGMLLFYWCRRLEETVLQIFQ